MSISVTWTADDIDALFNIRHTCFFRWLPTVTNQLDPDYFELHFLYLQLPASASDFTP